MEILITIIQYILFHVAVSIGLFIIIDKNKDKSQNYFKKRFFKIKESQHLMNQKRFMNEEDIALFKEKYKENSGIYKPSEDSLTKFFIYGWALILFFVIFSYIAEHAGRNLKISIEKENAERKRQEQLEIQAYKDIITSRDDD